MSRQKITTVIGFFGLLLLLLPVSGMASYGYPNGPQINAVLIENALLMETGTVAASEIRLVVKQHGKPSWEWGEWKTRSARRIALRETSRLTPVVILLLAVLALAIKRWRGSLLLAGAVVLVAVMFAPKVLDWLPPYKSFSYLTEFMAVPDASYPGDADALLLYEKPDLRPEYPTKAVVFCNGQAGRLSMDEIQAVLQAKGVANTEHPLAPDSHSSGR